MVRYYVTINGTDYHLAEKQDADAIEAEILHAAQTGAGFVDLSREHDGSVRVLITNSSVVAIRELSGEDFPTDDSPGQHYDPDYYQV